MISLSRSTQNNHPTRHRLLDTCKTARSRSRRERVIVRNHHGENLQGILHYTGSPQLVIVCHGFQSSKDQQPMLNIAAALENHGVSAFRFDFAGNGESEGTFKYGNYYREVDDLRAVVHYFQKKNYIISALVGHSKGGNVVIFYASKYNDVNAVVNISGRFNLERGIEGRLGKDFLQRIKKTGFIDVKNRRGEFEYRVTEQSLLDRLTTNTRAACLLVHQDTRVMTVHGSKDKIVPVECSGEFAKYLANHKLYIVEGADHVFSSHQNELCEVVLEFIKASICKQKDVSVESLPATLEKKSVHPRL